MSDYLQRNSIITAVASSLHNSIGGTDIQVFLETSECSTYTVKIDFFL